MSDKRLTQFFVAPGPEDEELPVADPSWRLARMTSSPPADWDAILAVARDLDPKLAEALSLVSHVLPSDGPPPAEDEVRALVDFLHRLEQAVRAAPPADEEGADGPVRSRDDHAGMCEAVRAV